MKIDSVLQSWSKLGAAFNVRAVENTPDIELLLIDTACLLRHNARLATVAVSWLYSNYRLVCRHRLAGFASEIDDPTTSAALGLLLDFVKSRTGVDHFNVIIKKCTRLTTPKPLFMVDQSSRELTIMAEAASSEIGLKWGLWCEDIQLKNDVIRPSSWIMTGNPQLKYRAVFNGNLRASILETLIYDSQSGQSESVLARCCGVTRKAVREALDHLEFCQMVKRSNVASRVTVTIS